MAWDLYSRGTLHRTYRQVVPVLFAIYAIVAFGFVVVYKTSKVFNFSHGALGAAGGLALASLVIGAIPAATAMRRSLADGLSVRL